MNLPQIQIHELNLLPPRSPAGESKGNQGMNFILRRINKAEPLSILFLLPMQVRRGLLTSILNQHIWKERVTQPWLCTAAEQPPAHRAARPSELSVFGLGGEL